MNTNKHAPHPLGKDLPTTGAEIENRSFELIDRYVKELRCTKMDARVIKRVVHATADVSIAKTMKIHPDAVSNGIAALNAGKPVFTDVRMLQVGITRIPGKAYCAISDERTINFAAKHGTTRAAAAMHLLGERLNGAIVAIGNAPTAIWKLLELNVTKEITPALIVGLPVGFVGAAESKQMLWESGLPCITNHGPRGGSPLAAAALNAIAIAAKEESTHE